MLQNNYIYQQEFPSTSHLKSIIKFGNLTMFLNFKLSTVNLIPEIKFTLYFFYKFRSYLTYLHLDMKSKQHKEHYVLINTCQLPNKYCIFYV